MNFQTILLSTVLVWNASFALECSNDGIQKQHLNATEINMANQLTLMEGYDRYLNEPNFQLSPMRDA